MKCKRDSDGRKLDHATLQAMRMQAVKAVKNGEDAKSVAAAYGMNVRTIFRWVALFAEGGQKALQAKPIPGRPPRLSGEQLAWLAATVRDHTPQQHRFAFALWTLDLIGELITRQFAVVFSRAGVGRVMRLLGFTPQRPLHRASQRDAVLVEQWRSEIYPGIRAEAKRVGATVLFADEAGMRSDYHAGTTWAPSGHTPVVETTGARFGFNMLSAVGASGHFQFMLHEGTVDAGVFLTFLQRLMADAQRPVFLIVDGHSIHKARIIKDYVAAQNGRLKLFYLPPYSPHLNPDEQVWANVKGRVGKQRLTDRHDLKAKLVAALERLRELPQVVAGFFRHPDCQYIIEP